MVPAGHNVSIFSVDKERPVRPGRTSAHSQGLAAVGGRDRVRATSVKTIEVPRLVEQVGKDVPRGSLRAIRHDILARRHPVHHLIGISHSVWRDADDSGGHRGRCWLLWLGRRGVNGLNGFALGYGLAHGAGLQSVEAGGNQTFQVLPHIGVGNDERGLVHVLVGDLDIFSVPSVGDVPGIGKLVG